MRWRLGSIDVKQHEQYDGFADTQALKVFPTSKARAPSQRHKARTWPDHVNPGHVFPTWTN